MDRFDSSVCVCVCREEEGPLVSAFAGLNSPKKRAWKEKGGRKDRGKGNALGPKKKERGGDRVVEASSPSFHYF